MSQTPIFDQLCAEFLKQRKVSYQSLLAPSKKPITPVVTLAEKLSNVDTQPIDVSTLRAS